MLGCPVVPLFTFLGGFGSLINPFKQKRAPFFEPRLLGSLECLNLKPLRFKLYGLSFKRFNLAYWLTTQLLNFGASYKVVYSESFNFNFLGFWASKLEP